MSIVEVINRYYPDWEAPLETWREWEKCLCPFHGESRPSAAVSYRLDAFNCFACHVKGDAISIIRLEEEVSYAEAVRIAEEVSVGGYSPVQGKPARKSSRRVFGEPGDTRKDNVRSGIRSRTAPWS